MAYPWQEKPLGVQSFTLSEKWGRSKGLREVCQNSFFFVEICGKRETVLDWVVYVSQAGWLECQNSQLRVHVPDRLSYKISERVSFVALRRLHWDMSWKKKKENTIKGKNIIRLVFVKDI